MNSSRPHPVFAAFLDYYFVSLIGMGLIALMNSIINDVIFSPMGVVILATVLILCIILYHAWFNKKTQFLSYGEIVAGKILVEKKKEWKNPYKKNRLFLFTVVIISLLPIGNTWNTAIFLVPGLAFVITSFIKILVILLGIYLVGRGRIKGVFVSLAPYLAGIFFTNIAYAVSGKTEYLILFVLFTVIITGSLVSFFYYRNQKGE